MAKEKKPVHRTQMTEDKRRSISCRKHTTNRTVENIRGALKDLMCETIKKVIEAEMKIRMS